MKCASSSKLHTVDQKLNQKPSDFERGTHNPFTVHQFLLHFSWVE